MQRIDLMELSESGYSGESSDLDESFEPSKPNQDELDESLLDAAEKGDLKTVDTLLRLGADVNYSDDIGYCALAIAAERGHEAVVRRLLQEETIDTTIEFKESEDGIGEGIALHIAAFNGYDNIVKMLVSHSPEDMGVMEYCGYTPLHETIVNRQFSTFMLLLRSGASCEDLTDDCSVTETPENLNALGLIMYELLDSAEPKLPLAKMLFWLLDNYKTDLPRYRPFKESKQGKKLYKLVEQYIDDPGQHRRAIMNFLQIDQKSLDDVSQKGVYGDLAECSDSDSEDDDNYEYVDRLELSRTKVEEKIGINFSNPEPEALIAHFRGIHRYPAHFKMSDKSLHLAKAQEQGSLPMQSIYSAASHELAGVPFELGYTGSLETEADIDQYLKLVAEREQKLRKQDQKILTAIQQMRSQKDVEPCLQTSSASRDRYESRYHEFIQRYVNSYASLLKDMEESVELDVSKLKSEARKQKLLLLKGLGFKKLPLVSTTEDVHWAFEYAASLVSYDKKKTFRPNPKSGAQPLRPCYLPNGRPRFPYLGIVYATLHSYGELLDESKSERVLDLFAENLIDTRCAAPGGHVTGGYIRAKERIFISSIDASRVFVAMIVRVPNLSFPYRSAMLEKYGLTEVKYNKFKANLLKSGPNEEGTALRNENLYFRTQLKIIEFVIEHQQQKLLNFITTCVKNKHFNLKALGSTSEDLIDSIIRGDKEEKDFIRTFIDQRKQVSLSTQSIFRPDESKKRKRDESEEKDMSPSKKPRKE